MLILFRKMKKQLVFDGCCENRLIVDIDLVIGYELHQTNDAVEYAKFLEPIDAQTGARSLQDSFMHPEYGSFEFHSESAKINLIII